MEMKIISKIKAKKITPEQLFMISVLIVNGGNYLYNLILGRYLGPEQFADAAVLITFLLVVSFIAMTFQLVTAKFSILFSLEVFASFTTKIYSYAFLVGALFGGAIVVFSEELQAVFNTSSSQMFVLFGVGVPFYFLMSVNRGIYQGKKEYKSLSITYQSEMLCRLILTFALLYFFEAQAAILIAIGIIVSFVFGLFPFKKKAFSIKNSFVISKDKNKQIIKFFALTAFYELTQIIINNSDILLVKHYFEAYEAGLYASLALIGRIVYFIAWMFVMLLLPAVVQLKKDGKPTKPILMKYLGYISFISFTIVFFCFLFPEQVIYLLFGESYVSMAPLLWKYALATSLFAISNIFAYYYLSLDRYVPVLFLGIVGLSQIFLIVYFHTTLLQVVHMQILAMILLLVVQLVFFFTDKKEASINIENE